MGTQPELFPDRPSSILVSGGYNAALLCRIFVGICFGIFEPVFLLLSLFSCIFVMQGSEEANYNFTIALFALGFTLPVCAAQVLCAIFTTVIQSSAFGSWIYMSFFSTFNSGLYNYCPSYSTTIETDANTTSSTVKGSLLYPPSTPYPPTYVTLSGNLENCAFCVFPLFSTLISVAFSLVYLIVAWRVTERVIAAVLNKRLIRRIRVMQFVVLVSLPLGLACRGVSIIFVPFDLAFEALRCADVVCIAVTVLTISYTLVLRPTYDSRMTDQAMKVSPDMTFGGAWAVDVGVAVEEEVAPETVTSSSDVGDQEPIGPDLLLPPQTQESREQETQPVQADDVQVEAAAENSPVLSPLSPAINTREGRDLNDTARIRVATDHLGRGSE